MDKTSKIYIPGHRGLVGSALVRRFTAAGYSNLVTRTSKELDLRRQSDVETFFEKEQPEYVLLAAAKVGGILANNTYKAEFIYDNLMIAANVIRASYKSGVKKLLNLGSSCIYPKFAPQPMKEEHLLTGLLEPTNEPYAIAKIAAIKLCRYYNEQYGTNYISAMPTNLYGPGDNFDLNNSHVLPALIRKLHLAMLASAGEWEGIEKDERIFGSIPDELIRQLAAISKYHGCNVSTRFERHAQNALPSAGIAIWGTGEPFREFLFVDDLADACLFLMGNCDYKDIGEFINVGTGEDVKIKDLAAMVRNIVGFSGEIQHDKTKPDGTPKKLLDVSRMQSLGWKPKVGLNEGIRITYDYYKRSEL